MARTGEVIEMGSLWESTRSYVDVAKIIVAREQKNKLEEEFKMKKEQVKFSFEMINNEKEEMGDLLSKAGIKASLYYPFKTKINSEGEMEFIPKNIFKMKKDSKKVKEKLQEALENNKITQEDFKTLTDNLNEMLKENGLNEEEQEDIEVTEEEIEELYDTFNQGIEENMEGLIASIGEETFEKMGKQYENMDLNDRKNALNKMNSEINKRLGIVGKLDFSTNKNLEFENSFIKGGYLLSEKDVSEKNFKDITRDMMEKGMVRKLMTKKNQTLSASQRQALYNKITQEKRMQERQKGREHPAGRRMRTVAV